MQIKVEIDENELRSEITRIIAKNLTSAYSSDRHLLKEIIADSVKEVVYSQKKEIIETVVNRASAEIVRKAVPELIKKMTNNE